MTHFKYLGDELSLFKEAINWKDYWIKSISPYVKGDVLEVGAGIGINTEMIIDYCDHINTMTSIEPDKKMSDEIIKSLNHKKFEVEVINGYLSDLNAEKKYDTILYIDVIEHIKEDSKELERAKSYLKDDGNLIVLVPAYNFLFSPFDKAIGHYRRYNKKLIRNAIPRDLQECQIYYLDSLGVFLSLINKYILKQKYPTKSQVLKWDKIVVPLSKISDKVIFNSVGKSLIGVWRK